MIPLDGVTDLPPKQKQQLLDSIEQMQARDRCAKRRRPPCYPRLPG